MIVPDGELRDSYKQHIQPPGWGPTSKKLQKVPAEYPPMETIYIGGAFVLS